MKTRSLPLCLLCLCLLMAAACQDDEDSPMGLIEKFQLCELPNSDSQCDSDQSSFNEGATTLTASVVVKNVDPEVNINFEWFYVDGGDQLIDKATGRLGDFGNSERYQVFSTLTSADASGFPAGKYEVEVYTDNEDAVMLSRSFTLE